MLTHDPKYRQAAIRHLANLMNWNQIGCEAHRGMPYDAPMFFCLSYGEHAANIGLMYDLFRPDIIPEEQRGFFDVLDRFYLKEALRCLERPPWWANKSWSNWNGVCAGGMGIMALAFYDDRPECQALIPFVEKSLGEYYTSFIKNGADCIPGTEAMEALRKAHAQRKDPVVRVYKGLDWAVLADDSAFPRLRLSARGGSSEITGHGHLDLLSFKCMVNGERMIGDQADGGYSPLPSPPTSCRFQLPVPSSLTHPRQSGTIPP